MGWHQRVGVLGLALLAGCRASDTEAPAKEAQSSAGFLRLRELGCANCHAGPGLLAEAAPRLAEVGARLTPVALEEALGGGARMPDCLAGLAAGERAAAAAALTHFLAGRGGPIREHALTFDAATLERGRALYHAVGCVACHAPFEGADTLARPLWEFEDAFRPLPAGTAPAPRGADPLALGGLRARTTLAALTRYLAYPLAVHPAGRMPALALSPGEAADLAAYLWYEDALDGDATGGAGLCRGPGLWLDVFEANFEGDTADFDALTPVRTELATSFFAGIPHPDDDFGFRFRGFVAIASAGDYRFSTTSDDGSMLYVDGRTVVDNRGQHGASEASGSTHLAAGPHALEVTYFEHLGDAELGVSWSGPGFTPRALEFEALSHLEVTIPALEAAPFEVDARLAERGRALYGELGCAACHEEAHAARGPALATLDPRAGCLASRPARGVPRYALGAGERADLAAAVRARTPPPASAEERLRAELTRLDCGACHARAGLLAGPSDARRAYFQVERGLDLGDEGRLPPRLDRVGAKLRPAWMRAVLAENGRARPYMKTRMPQFGTENVADLAPLFAEVDAPLRDEREPEFSLAAVEAGKELVGTKALGCIQCHEFAGHPSLGIPAVDLAKVHERIYPGWFRELLMDPIALNMNTRMPTFWSDGRSPVALLDHDPVRQVDALWTYLSLGSSMPLPAGLVPLEGEYEVEVTDTPVVVGVFMEGVSPRTLAVGLPERVHYAFDVQNSRLAKAWRGRFLDARGTWYARAGQLENPAGEDVLEFPSGSGLMMLDARDDPWPPELGRAAGCRVLGRRFDQARRPIFDYSMCGVRVAEEIEPVLRPGGAVLRRRFSLPLDASQENVFLRVAVGTSIQREDPDTWLIQGERELRVKGLGEWGFVHRDDDGHMELRFPVRADSVTRTAEIRTVGQPDSVEAVYEVEYSW